MVIFRAVVDQKTLPQQNRVESLYNNRNVLEQKAGFTAVPIIRLPGTLILKALCFTADVFLFFFRHAISELPRPIAAKLCHMIAIWVRFIMQVQKFGGHSPRRNWGPKTCKIWRDFRQLQTSIANISGMGQDIQNRKEMYSP